MCSPGSSGWVTAGVPPPNCYSSLHFKIVAFGKIYESEMEKQIIRHRFKFFSPVDNYVSLNISNYRKEISSLRETVKSTSN